MAEERKREGITKRERWWVRDRCNGAEGGSTSNP